MPTPHHLRNLGQEVHKTTHVLDKTRWLGRRACGEAEGLQGGQGQRSWSGGGRPRDLSSGWGRAREEGETRHAASEGSGITGHQESPLSSRGTGATPLRLTSSATEGMTAHTHHRAQGAQEREGVWSSVHGSPPGVPAAVGIIPCTFKCGHFSSTRGVRSHTKERTQSTSVATRTMRHLSAGPACTWRR